MYFDVTKYGNYFKFVPQTNEQNTVAGGKLIFLSLCGTQYNFRQAVHTKNTYMTEFFFFLKNHFTLGGF